jgi:hypothetical protein
LYGRNEALPEKGAKGQAVDGDDDEAGNVILSAGAIHKIAAMLRTVRVFRQKFTREDAIGSHACSFEANMRVTNGIPLGSSLLLPVCTVNSVQTLKARTLECG